MDDVIYIGGDQLNILINCIFMYIWYYNFKFPPQSQHETKCVINTLNSRPGVSVMSSTCL